MPTLPRSLSAMLALLYAMVAGVGIVTPALAQTPQWRVLVFSKTAGFRHDSIAAGIATVQALGEDAGFGVDATEDATVFSAANLANYAAVVWLNTTGDVLDAAQQAAFADYVRAGGGYVGVHSAADTEYDWPFYGELLAGAWFASHPEIQSALLRSESATHPATSALPARFGMTDEWYNFRGNPRGSAQVLLTLDETSYEPGAGAMGSDHPIAWARSVGAGRAIYTGLGHRSETFADARMRAHLAGAIAWASGRSGTPVFANGFEPAAAAHAGFAAQGVLRGAGRDEHAIVPCPRGRG